MKYTATNVCVRVDQPNTDQFDNLSAFSFILPIGTFYIYVRRNVLFEINIFFFFYCG